MLWTIAAIVWEMTTMDWLIVVVLTILCGVLITVIVWPLKERGSGDG